MSDEGLPYFELRDDRSLRMRSICIASNLCRLFAGWTLATLMAAPGFAQQPAAPTGPPVDFERDVRPIFNQHCVACHGGVKQAAELSFVYADKVLAPAGSDAGVVVAGHPENSELIRRITSQDPEERMPPVTKSRDGLSPAEVEILQRWIASGAHWKPHWSYVAPVAQPLPVVSDAHWPRVRTDHFILSRLESRGIAPAGDEISTRWLRRVFLDLIGLPPTVEQRKQFLDEYAADPEAARTALVDRLLASPRFGERWASKWLDLVRYADSKGLGKDERRDNWRYRDWVIEAFNQDLPYDQFTIRQMAGDLLPDRTVNDLIATGVHRLTQTNGEGGTDDEEFRVSAVIDRVNTTWQVWQGISFGCAQCHHHPYDPVQHEEYYRFLAFFNNTADVDTDQEFPVIRAPLHSADMQRAGELDRAIRDLNDTLWRQDSAALFNEPLWTALQGITVHAEPPAELRVDVRFGREEFVTPVDIQRGSEISVTAEVPPPHNVLTAIRFTGMPRELEKASRDTEWGFILNGLTAEIVDPAGAATPLKIAQVIADEPEPFFDPQNTIAEAPPARGRRGGRGGGRGSQNGFSAYSRIDRPRSAAFLLETPATIPAGSRLRVKLAHNVFYLDSFAMVTGRGRIDVSGSDVFTRMLADETRIEQRRQLAELRARRDRIPSAIQPVLRELPEHLARTTYLFERGAFLSKGKTVTAGVPESFPPLPPGLPANRLALARWLVSPENPLTARVAVNRVWASLFETGLVATEEDFGSSGERPSHPELLDDLAQRFQTEMKWSMKTLIRELVLSRTYGQSARVRPELAEVDPDNRLLAQGPRGRLPAEVIRDQALAASGLISNTFYGAPVHPPIPEGVWMPFDAADKWETPPVGADARYRRSIYTYAKRSIPYPTFATFDAPSREFCTSRRLTSNTPLQALATLNDETFQECAKALGKLAYQFSGNPRGRIAHAYVLTLQREPDEQEIATLSKMLEQYGPDREQFAYSVLATVLLNSDEFLTK